MNDGYEDFDLLKEIVGEAEAQKIAEIFKGAWLYIPKNIILDQKHLKIKQDYSAGATYKELSIRYGYTTNYIRKIVNRSKK
jgi:Mor family transcriptional regulator